MAEIIRVGNIVTPIKEGETMCGHQGIVWDVQPHDSTGHTIGVHFPSFHMWRSGGHPNPYMRLGITYFEPQWLRLDTMWVGPGFYFALNEAITQSAMRDADLLNRGALLLGRPVPEGVGFIPNRHPFLACAPCEINGCKQQSLRITVALVNDAAVELYTCEFHHDEHHGKVTPQLPQLQPSRKMIAAEIERTRKKIADRESIGLHG